MNDTPSPDADFGTTSSHDPFIAAKASAMKAAEELRAAAAQKATELRQAAEQRAHQFKSAAEQKAGEFKEKAEEFRGYAGDAIGEAQERYDRFVADAERITREKPRQALLTAFGVGVLIGLLMRR